MHRRGRSWVVVLVAGLVVPTLLLAAWAVLELGGLTEDQRRRERAHGQEAIESAVKAALETVAGLEPGPGIALIALDAAGRPASPFLPAAEVTRTPPSPTPRPPILDAAVVIEAGGDANGALAFFDRALPLDTRWDAQARLAFARALAAGGHVARARKIVAGGVPPDASRGPLPWELMKDLLLTRIAADAGDAQAAHQLAKSLCAHAYRVPADAAAPLVAWINERVSGEEIEGLDMWLATARAFAGLENGWLSVADDRGGPEDPWLRAHAEGALVVPRDRVRTLVGEAVARVDARLPETGFGATHGGATHGGAILARGVLPPLGDEIVVISLAPLMSARLEFAERTLLALAGIAFLLGNLLAWRLVHREAAVSRLKSQFIDTVSHELRTPLTSLTLKAEMLRAGDVPEGKQDAYVAGLHDEAKKLGGLVERILDFSRIERGRERLAIVDVPVRRLLARGIHETRRLLAATGQRLRVHVPRDLPAVMADEELMTRAVRNLLENAAKYAPAGTEVTVSAAARPDSVAIEVADRGPGIPPAERRAVLEPFRRLHRKGAAHVAGSGLGLALVARAAEAHGGRVEIGERRGGGAVFRISLPSATSGAVG